MQLDPEDYLLNGSPSLTPPSIQELLDPPDLSQLQIRAPNNNQLQSSQILLDYFTNSLTQKSGRRSGAHTKGSSRKTSNKIAAQRYRQKRRSHAKCLEDSVNCLQQEIKACEQEIREVKTKLTHLVSASKIVKQGLIKGNQHGETYAELATCAASEEPDLDKINLLLDTLKYRIGANGRQRQAKIDYFFKQIVNTIFPALHRYLMYCAKYKKDIFSEQTLGDNNSFHAIGWTHELYKTVTPQQMNRIKNQYAQKLVDMRNQTLKEICQLTNIKLQLKDDQEALQNIIDQLRKSMHPVQSAHWILYCEKHKYRKEVSLQMEFDESSNGLKGRKRLKIQTN